MKITARIELPKKLTAKIKELKMPLSGGYEEGYDDGYKDGYVVGEGDGYSKGESAGYDKGYTAGETSGYNKGLEEGADALDTLDGIIEGNLSGHYRNDRVTKINTYGFYSNNELTSVDLPNVTRINNYGFASCVKLTSANMPLLTTIGASTFSNSGITQLDLPLVKKIPLNMCYAAANLQRVSFDTATEMQSGTNFAYCYVLTAVILRNNAVCKLASANAFQCCYHILGTVNATYNPEGLKDGYIYVPDDLVEDYKVATNWVTYASQIKPLSELGE